MGGNGSTQRERRFSVSHTSMKYHLFGCFFTEYWMLEQKLVFSGKVSKEGS